MIPLARLTNELGRMKSAKQCDSTEREQAVYQGPWVHVRARTCGRLMNFPGRGRHIWKENQARARLWEAQLGQNILSGVSDTKGACVAPPGSPNRGPHRCTCCCKPLTAAVLTAPASSLERGIVPRLCSYPVVTPQRGLTQADVSEVVSEKGPGMPWDASVPIHSPGTWSSDDRHPRAHH